MMTGTIALCKCVWSSFSDPLDKTLQGALELFEVTVLCGLAEDGVKFEFVRSCPLAHIELIVFC